MQKVTTNKGLRLRRLTARLCAGLALSIAMPATAQVQGAAQPAPASPAIDYTRPGQLVTLADGRHINLRCMGAGATTVILDAGGGQFSLAWRKVEGEVAKFTRVCAYDRAGYGFSDANTRTSSAANIVDDLHQALDRAGIRPPLLMAGHSAGGSYALVYAELHPADVVGLVLVDPGFASGHHDDATIAYAAFPELLAKFRADQATHTALMQRCVQKARAGLLTGDLGECTCLETPEDMPQLADFVRDYCRTPKQFEGMIAEESAGVGRMGDWPSQSDRDMAAAAKPLGRMPVTVLTNGLGFHWSGNEDLDARLNIVWRAGHVAIAGQSERGKVVVVQDSYHTINVEKPQAVIDAIHEMLQDVETAHAQ